MADTSMHLASHPDSTIVGTVDRLRSTFDSGRTQSYGWRSEQLQSLDAMLSQHEDDFVGALVEDLRRTPFEAVLFDIAPTKGELKYRSNTSDSGSSPTGFGRLWVHGLAAAGTSTSQWV
jgi:aldehyde dehydrogenase (NAD+)